MHLWVRALIPLASLATGVCLPVKRGALYRDFNVDIVRCLSSRNKPSWLNWSFLLILCLTEQVQRTRRVPLQLCPAPLCGPGSSSGPPALCCGVTPPCAAGPPHPCVLRPQAALAISPGFSPPPPVWPLLSAPRILIFTVTDRINRSQFLGYSSLRG